MLVPEILNYCAVAWCDGLRYWGFNPNVDGDLYIPFNATRFLGSAPNGFGQQSSSISDMTKSGGPTSDSAKFYVSFQLYDADIPAGGTFNPASTYGTITLEDIVTDVYSMAESASIELAPADPANPGVYTLPTVSSPCW